MQGLVMVDVRERVEVTAGTGLTGTGLTGAHGVWPRCSWSKRQSCRRLHMLAATRSIGAGRSAGDEACSRLCRHGMRSVLHAAH